VTREPEWDDAEREAMLGLRIYRRGLCSGCGFHHDVTADKANHFTFEDDRCPVCKGAAQWSRLQQMHDEAAVTRLGERPSPMAVRPTDGRSTVIRRLSPLEVEARQMKPDVTTDR